MKVVTAEQMHNLDAAAQAAGVSVAELMENAGHAVFEVAASMLEIPEGKCVVLLCHKGNNGGDGLVAARYLHNWGARVQVFLTAPAGELSGAALDNYRAAREAGLEIREEAGPQEVARALPEAALVVDALLGSGLKGAPQGPLAEIIAAANAAPCPTLAVDIPSGVNADTGEVAGIAFRADHTVTMGLPKYGLLLFPGAGYTGQLTVADIGFPAHLLDKAPAAAQCLTQPEAGALLPARARDAHKGDCGRVLVIAGSTGYTGAAALASLAALRAGAGLVTLALPARLNAVMETKLTEVITAPMPDTEAGAFSAQARAPILQLAQKSDCVLLGPGLSLAPEAAELARRLAAEIEAPLVVDADALTALSQDLAPLEGRRAPVILTPHPGEMARLTGLATAQVQSARLAASRELAARISGVVILKGAASLVAEPAGRLFINNTGNPGLATAGTGDVLAGLLAGLLAQKVPPFAAAGLAVFLHGLAGDLAAAQTGQLSLIASDLLEALPQAILTTQEAAASRGLTP